MTKSCYEKVNWDRDPKEIEKIIYFSINELEEFLKSFDSRLKILPKSFFENYFYVTLNLITFENFLINKSIFWPELNSPITNLKKLNFISGNLEYIKLKKSQFIDIKSLPKKKIVNASFFKRHQIYEEEAKKNIEFENLNLNCNLKISQNKLISLNLLKKVLPDLGDVRILGEINFLINNFQILINANYPNILLTNSHSIYDVKNRIFLSFAKLRNCKIINLQVGFMGGLVKYFYQTEYEKKISDIYLSIGKKGGIEKNYPFGSMYSYRFGVNKKNENLILLPQVPFRNNPLPISSYWSETRQEFLKRKDKIFDYLKRLCADFNHDVSLRCKLIDKKFYETMLKKNNIKFNSLILGDIEKGNPIDSYNNVYVTYLTTAMIETFATSKNVQLKFDQFKNYLIDEVKNDLNISCASNNISQFMEKYSINLTPEKSAKILNQLIFEQN